MSYLDKINQLGRIFDDDEKFKISYDKIIKLAIKTILNTKEIREELMDVEEVFQTCLIDINFNYWLKISDNKIQYMQGLHKNPAIIIKMKKKTIVKIIKGELIGAEAYMKGLIRVDGNITKGLKYIKIYRTLLEYLITMKN
ncbi:MAG: SCP2 sterol-binding domain-containing protein [Promethearchaeota archaeon]